MKKIFLVVVVAALVMGAGLTVFLWEKQQMQEKREERFYQIRQSADLSQEEEDLVEIPVDFPTLEKINPDIYAWITVPGTGIDTPVLQKEGDISYYLSHSWTGEKDVDGAVCSESKYNGKDFEDVHTVLYGNSCEDGSMFAGLHAFEDEMFFDTHKIIAVYTRDSIRYYRIFAAYEYDGRHLLESFDLNRPKIFTEYVDSILRQRNLYAHVDEQTEIRPGDKLLTLSTESIQNNGKTYLVQGVLEKTFIR